MRASSVVAAVLMAGGTVGAQSYPVPEGSHYGHRPIAYHNGHHPSPDYGHASTAQEGFLRGLAELPRAAGSYNYQTSLALVNREEARRQALITGMMYRQWDAARRQANREARAQYHREHRATAEDLTALAKQRIPKRLTARQYEPALGKLHWPAVLASEPFAAGRARIDELMRSRTVAQSGLGTANHRQVRALVTQMNETLRQEIRTLSPSEYVAAQKFLKSLNYEARLELPIAGLAAN